MTGNQTRAAADEDDAPEPPQLRRLRLMVTGFTAFLMIAVLVVIVLLVIRLTQEPRAVRLELPDTIILPEGVKSESATFTATRLLVIGRDEEGSDTILIYDRETGALLGTIQLETE